VKLSCSKHHWFAVNASPKSLIPSIDAQRLDNAQCNTLKWATGTGVAEAVSKPGGYVVCVNWRLRRHTPR
jgi:hypothetical protein